MYAISAIAILAFAGRLTAGAAIPEPTAAPYLNNLVALGYGAYVCQNANWQGACRHFKSQRNACVDLDNSQLNRAITSFGPDKHNNCKVYKERFCGGRETRTISWPGIAVLGDEWNDKIKSFQCELETIVEVTRQPTCEFDATCIK
ncbi:hypothetical protein K490DRAFT_54384 [Saccharata proteae CBS 121410]|uniref:Secreted protein n=1 Tax=Saccharata proteae CBS 121410 TaxID=1314787 RepID=A0A9P4HXZ8_9PEZI|nr:hypothetical protein K490DRAFT_54384 [Saccharata proteae CBS 121410]